MASERGWGGTREKEMKEREIEIESGDESRGSHGGKNERKRER